MRSLHFRDCDQLENWLKDILVTRSTDVWRSGIQNLVQRWKAVVDSEEEHKVTWTATVFPENPFLSLEPFLKTAGLRQELIVLKQLEAATITYYHPYLTSGNGQNTFNAMETDRKNYVLSSIRFLWCIPVISCHTNYHTLPWKYSNIT